MKNRRGDIPIMILVIGVFVVCALALLSFFMSSANVKNSFFGVGLIEKINSQIEAYSQDSLVVVESKINDEGQKVFYQEKKGELGYVWEKEVMLFSVEYPIPS